MLDDIQLDIVVTLQGSQAIKSATTALQGLSRSADGVRAKSEALRPVTLKEMRSWDSLTEALGRVERKYDAVFRAGAHMTMMGQGLMDSGEKIGRGLIGIVEKYEDYDLMLRRAGTALNTNTEWQGKLDDAIKETATTIGLFSPEEVAEAYYIWGAAAGVVVDTQEELNDITKVVQDTMIATAMAGGTLEGNLNGVYGVLAQFNLPAGQAVDVVHDLALMTERTAAQFPDLINSLTYIGPLAESLGITFEDVTSTLGILADAGQKGSRAGRGLSMVIEGMSAPSAKAKESLDSVVQATHGLNAEWEDIVFPKGEFIGMRGLVMELSKGLDGMTDAQRGAFYATAFTNNATRALIPVIEDQIDANRRAAESGKEANSVLDDQKYSLEGAEDFWIKMRDSALGSITAIRTRLENSFFPILQTVAQTIMKEAEPVINFLGDMATKISEFVDNNPELVKSAVHLAAIASAALTGAGILFTFGGAILYIIGNLGNFVEGIGRVMAPWVALGVVVGMVIDAIVRNVGHIQEAAKMFWRSFQNLVRQISGTSFTEIWSEMWGAIQDAVDGAVSFIADVLTTLSYWMNSLAKNKEFTGFMNTAIGIFVRFRSAIAGLVVLGGAMWAFSAAFGFFVNLLKIVSGYNTVKGIILGVIGAIKGASTAIAAIRALTVAFTLFGVSVNIALGPIILVIGAIIAIAALLFLAWQTNFMGIRDIVANVWDWITNTALPAIVGFFQSIIDWVVNMVTTVVEWFGKLPENIGNFLTMIWEAITGWIGSVIEAIGGFISTVIEAILGFFQNLVDNWDYYLGFILGFVLGWGMNIVSAINRFVDEMVEKFLDFLHDLPGHFADWFGRTWTTLSTWFTGTAIPGVGRFLTDLWNNITTFLHDLPGNFARWFGEVWNTVSTWFKGFIGDAGDWARGAVNNIVKFFKELPGKAVDGIKFLIPKFLTFFHDLPGAIWDKIVGVGKAIVDGVWRGIQNAWNTFWDNVHDFFSGIVDGVKKALGIRSPSKVFAEIGGYMVDGMAVGIMANDSAQKALGSYANSLVGLAQSTSLGFSAGLDGLPADGVALTSDNTKVLRIEMDLTSSDGSYDDATLEQLKAALTGSDLVRALERMAEAG